MSSEPPAHESSSAVSPPGKSGPLSGGAGALLAVVLLGATGYLFYNNFWKAGADEPADTLRWYLCTADNNAFTYAMKKGEMPPVTCPACKKTTAYPAEACYWTRDGGIKDKPTYVVLNKHLGKEGDTICPDCGRVVVGHNPDPRKTRPHAETALPTTAPEETPTDRDR